MNLLKIAMLIIFIFPASSQANSNSNAVLELISLFQSGDRVEISKNIAYPLSRNSYFEIADVNGPVELLYRFDNIFDKELIDLIAGSSISDWSQVGKRGIMFKKGEVWIDFDGKIIAVNLSTRSEAQLAADINKYFSQHLHGSISDFSSLMHTWETADYKILIYKGDDEIKYASWAASSSIHDKPDLIIGNGIASRYGSGGHLSYEFSNGEYYYTLTGLRNNLEVRHNEEVLLRQEATREYLFGLE